MKREDNALDDFLRQQVEGAHFEPGPADWERMSALLDDEDGKKKRPFLWRGLSVFIAVALLGGAALLWSGSKKDRDVNADGQASVSETALVSAVPEKRSIPAPVASEQAVDSGSLTENTTEKAGSASGTARSADPRRGQEPSGIQPEKRKRPQQDQTEQRGETPGKREPQAANTLPNQAVAVTPKISQAASRKAEKALRNQKRKSDRMSRRETARNPSHGTAASQHEAEKIKQSVPVAVNTQSEQVLGRPMQRTESTVYRPGVLEAGGNYHPRYIASLKDYVAERIDSVQVITFSPVAAPVSVIPPVADSTPSAKGVFKPMPLEFFVMAGVNANKGLKGNETTQLAWAMSPFVSFGFQKQLSPKLSLATQVGFTYFNGLNLESKVASYRYSFGVDSTVFTVNYRKLLQFYLPLTLSYTWRRGHDILLSAGMTYATDMNSLVKENQQAAAYSANGYRNGFAAFDMMAQAGYQVRINTRFAALLLWQQGFRDLTDNQYFNQQQSHRQSKLSLGIKYHFTRHGK